REVDERPLVRGLREEADLVAGLDAGGDEALRDVDDLGVELARGDVAPAALPVRHGEERAIGGRPEAVDQQVGRVRGRVRGDDGGDFDLLHGSSFGTVDVFASVYAAARLVVVLWWLLKHL